MSIPCGYGLGGGITLVAGFPLPDEFLEHFYDAIYKDYAHVIDFSGREHDFGTLHITLFAITGTKRNPCGGHTCRLSLGDSDYWTLKKEQRPLDPTRLVQQITDVIRSVLDIPRFSLTLKDADIRKNHNVRLTFAPEPNTSDNAQIVRHILQIPDKIEVGQKSSSPDSDKTDSVPNLHCTIGRTQVPFAGFKYRDKHGHQYNRETRIKEKLQNTVKAMGTLTIDINSLKLVHYRRSSLLGINGYILLPLRNHPQNSTMAAHLQKPGAIEYALGLN